MSKNAIHPESKDLGSDEESDGFNSEESEEGDSATGLTQNQNRLLFLVERYTHPAQNEEEDEEWIRKPAMMVLIYECIVQKVLDFDYAPASSVIEGRRKFFNVSQEGRSDLDYLREEELVNGLKLASKDFQPVTCYQISEKGYSVVKKISKADKDAVAEAIYAPNTKDRLSVEWDNEAGEYSMTSEKGYRRKSSVTETEDVSYVSSAYVPQCLRMGGRPTMSNAHRAHECKTENNIRDELDEVITLNSVSIIVSEYIPFGANQIVALNANLGSTERVQGGFFTAVQDDDASGTKFTVPPGLTSVNVLDYTPTNHINFEADIHFPVEDGVVQVETFGVSMRAHGTMFYGMQVEAVLDRIKDNISLDHLSRLLVDVQIDSSKIVDSVISQYQRDLMNLVFMGDASNRNKINLVLANEITPHLTAEEYMDKGEYENELKQVLGETRAAYDISEHDTLVFGESGLMVAGANSRHHEPLLCAFLQFTAMDAFTKNFFVRMFCVLASMDELEASILSADDDPNSIRYIRDHLARLQREVIMLEEILGYLIESIENVEVPPEPPEQSGRALYERLQIHVFKDQLTQRIYDLKKNLNGARNNMASLRERADILTQTRAYRVSTAVNDNSRRLIDLQEANRRSADTLQLMQYLIGGLLSFDIMDRITGDWSVMNTEWMREFTETLIRQPVAWLGLNLLMWIIVGGILWKCMKNKSYYADGTVTLRTLHNEPINIKKLTSYLSRMEIISKEGSYINDNSIITVKYQLPKKGKKKNYKREWGGFAPIITLQYDEKTQFMLASTLTYNKRKADKKLVFNSKELKQKFQETLSAEGVWVD